MYLKGFKRVTQLMLPQTGKKTPEGFQVILKLDFLEYSLWLLSQV